MKAFLATLIIEIGQRVWKAILKAWDEYQKKKARAKEIKEVIKTTPDAQERARKIEEILNR